MDTIRVDVYADAIGRLARKFARICTGYAALSGILVPCWNDLEEELACRMEDRLANEVVILQDLVRAPDISFDVFGDLMDEWLEDYIAVYKKTVEV